MRSASFAVVVLGCSVALASAAEDCSIYNSTSTAAEVPEGCGGFKDGAAVVLSDLNCGTASVTAADWLAEFTTCVNAIPTYAVGQTDQSGMCACYKKFVQFGFNNECQEPPLIRALAIQGFRFGVGQPLFDRDLTIVGDGSTQPTCALTGLDSTTGIYTGPGSLFTAPVSNPPVLNVAQGCVPACATICPYEDCAPASSIALGGAAFALVFAAVASLMQ